MRQDPYSIEAVSNLLKRFENQVHLIKGNSNQILKKIDMSGDMLQRTTVIWLSMLQLKQLEINYLLKT